MRGTGCQVVLPVPGLADTENLGRGQDLEVDRGEKGVPLEI